MCWVGIEMGKWLLCVSFYDLNRERVGDNMFCCSGGVRDSFLVTQVTAAKLRELMAGVDGFMVYDLRLVPVMVKVGRVQCFVSLSIIPSFVLMEPILSVSVKYSNTFHVE